MKKILARLLIALLYLGSFILIPYYTGKLIGHYDKSIHNITWLLGWALDLCLYLIIMVFYKAIKWIVKGDN